MDRRYFVKLLGVGATAVAINPSSISQTLFASDGIMYKTYEKVQLTDKDGNPIKLSDLKEEVNYVFNYPYMSTPCFIINLGEKTESKVELTTEDGDKYEWTGGIGKNNAVVSYSAICAHALTHPNPSDSFIKYVPRSGKTMAYSEAGVIVCSAHLSAYDPKRGAKNLAGEAKQPLASIVLEHAADDTIYAVGVLGNGLFHQFFKGFKPELKERYGSPVKAKKLVSISAPTVVLSEYSADIIQY